MGVIGPVKVLSYSLLTAGRPPICCVTVPNLVKGYERTYGDTPGKWVPLVPPFKDHSTSSETTRINWLPTTSYS